MTTFTTKLLVTAIGGVIYCASRNGKACEIGRLGFFAGLLSILLSLH